MRKKISVSCECEGKGFIAVADNGSEGVEHVECGQRRLTFKDAPKVDELLSHIGKQTGISSEFFCQAYGPDQNKRARTQSANSTRGALRTWQHSSVFALYGQGDGIIRAAAQACHPRPSAAHSFPMVS